MEKRSKVAVGIMMLGMTLLLFALPLSAKETWAQPKPEGTLNVALSGLAEEGFLPDFGDLMQAWAWSLTTNSLINIQQTGNPYLCWLKGSNIKRFPYLNDAPAGRYPVARHGEVGEVTAEDVKYLMNN